MRHLAGVCRTTPPIQMRPMRLRWRQRMPMTASQTFRCSFFLNFYANEPQLYLHLDVRLRRT